MKKQTIQLILVAAVFLMGTLISQGTLSAQQDLTDVKKQLRDMNVEIPFVDNDGDGINDLLQNGWGLRFLRNYQRRMSMWNELNIEGNKEENLVDTDGDGVPDTPFHQYMRGQMNQLVDTDGDGEPDTPLRQHLRKRFQTFDLDGDGIPDECTPEQIREMMQANRQWRKQIRDQLLNGEDPFVDADGDGVPDNLPPFLGMQRRHKGGKGDI